MWGWVIHVNIWVNYPIYNAFQYCLWCNSWGNNWLFIYILYMYSEHQNCTVVLQFAEVLPLVHPQTNATLGSPPSSSSRPTSSSLASTSASHSWPENVKVLWNLIPGGIKSAVENGQRPSLLTEDKLLESLLIKWNFSSKHDTNPTRSQCLLLAK